MPEIMGGAVLDQMVPIDFSSLQNETNNTSTGGFGPLDWQGSADQAMSWVQHVTVWLGYKNDNEHEERSVVQDGGESNNHDI